MSNENEVVVKIEGVSFAYNQARVLSDISLDIHKGEFLGIIGPNGSGKSTLLKIIVGVLKPKKGAIQLFGTELGKFKDWSRIGYVPQRAGSVVFHFPVTVEEIVSMGGNSKKSVEEALQAVEMLKFRRSLVRELSGGQQQRVFIARALASSPELLILDEPTAGVDVEAQAEFYGLLRKLNRELKLTLVLVSHDIDVVANEVTMIACINSKLICHLPPKQFIKSNYLEKIYGKDLKFILHGH